MIAKLPEVTGMIYGDRRKIKTGDGKKITVTFKLGDGWRTQKGFPEYLWLFYNIKGAVDFALKTGQTLFEDWDGKRV